MGFSPDRKTLVVVSIGSNSVSFIDTATNQVRHITYVGRSPHEAFFTPDGKQVWFTLKDTGKVQVFNVRPPFNILKTLDTGPITNHVNIVEIAQGSFARVTVGGLNRVNVYRTDNFSQVASIPVGNLPHGLCAWRCARGGWNVGPATFGDCRPGCAPSAENCGCRQKRAADHYGFAV